MLADELEAERRNPVSGWGLLDLLYCWLLNGTKLSIRLGDEISEASGPDISRYRGDVVQAIYVTGERGSYCTDSKDG